MRSPRRLLASFIKLVALVVGAGLTMLSLSALAGGLHPSLPLRLASAIVVGIALPILWARRLRPDAPARKSAGLTTDALALIWLITGFAFVGAGISYTQPLLVAESSRWAELGVLPMARGISWLAGVRWQADTAGNGGSPYASASSAGATAATAVKSGGEPSAEPSTARSAASVKGGAGGTAATATALASAASSGGSTETAPDGGTAGGPAPSSSAAPRSVHDLLREQAVAIVTLAVRVHRDIRSATAVVVADGGFVMALRRPLLGAEAVAARLADGSWIDGAELRVIDEDLGAVVLRFDLAAAGTIPPRSAGIAGALPAPVYCLGDPLGIGLTVRETELHTAAAAPRRASSVPPPLTVGCQCPAGDVVLSVTGALQGIALGCDAAPGPRSERGLLLPVPALAALLQRARTTTPTPVPGLGSPPF